MPFSFQVLLFALLSLLAGALCLEEALYYETFESLRQEGQLQQALELAHSLYAEYTSFQTAFNLGILTYEMVSVCLLAFYSFKSDFSLSVSSGSV